MKNPLIKLACVTLLTTATSAAFANKPVNVKLGMGFDQGFGVTAQFDNNINAFVGNDGISADYLLRKGSFGLDIPLNWYVGVGGSINWHKDNEYSVRVPLGLSLPFAKSWDVYGQVAPKFGYKDKSNNSGFKFGTDFSVGIRYAF